VIPEPALEFTRLVAGSIPGIRAIVLAGSFARGDQRPTSDIDLLVIAERVDTALLERIGDAVTSIATSNELNPAVVSHHEFTTRPDLVQFLKYKHDGRCLHGTLPVPSAPFADELERAQAIAHEVLMSVRHYLAVKEDAVRFQAGKLHPYVLKPLSFSLRFYHFHLTSTYIREHRALVQRYPVLALDPVRDWREILIEAHGLCERILTAAR
jgi:predicted nucleotidyltransferase